MKRVISLFIGSVAFLLMFSMDGISGPSIEELEQELIEIGEIKDTSRVNILNSLAWKWRRKDTQIAKDYANKAFRIAKEINYPLGLAKAYKNIGVLHKYTGEYDKALEALESVLEISLQIGDKQLEARSYSNIASVHYNKSDYDDALRLYEKSLMLDKAANDLRGMSIGYNNVGNIYKERGAYSLAIENYYKSLLIDEKRGDKSGMAVLYNNFGLIYEVQGYLKDALANYKKSFEIKKELGNKRSMSNTLSNMANVYCKLENYDEAQHCIQESICIREELEDLKGLGNSYLILGTIERQKGNNKESIDYTNLAISLRKELGNDRDLANAYLYQGLNYRNLGEYKASLAWLNSGLEIADTDNKEILKSLYGELKVVWEELGDIPEAFKYSKLFTQVSDTLLIEERDKQMASIEAKIAEEKQKGKIAILQRDQEIQNLEIERQKLFRNALFFAIVSLIALIALVLSRYFLKAKAHTILEEKNKVIRVEKERSEKLLLNILPADTAKELKEKGRANARYYKEVSVLFTDVKGFTEFADLVSPEELVEEIDYCFKGFDGIIESYPIEKIKTIGDSYMCASGLPQGHSGHAEYLVKAGLEMQAFMEEIKNAREIDGKPFFEIRIGIHTGPVVAGIVGYKKFAYDIWGSTVNIAASMQESGEVGKVNISKATFEKVNRKFSCRYRGKIAVKNNKEIEMYFAEKRTLIEA